MLRIIVRTDDASMAANVGGNVHTTYCTLDVSAPEVETFMREKLGLYVERRIVGVEVIDGVKPSDAADAVVMFRTAKQQGIVAGDGQLCPNDHDPDCRWPECLCRTRGVKGEGNG